MTVRRRLAFPLVLCLLLVTGSAAASSRTPAVTLFMAPWCSYCMHAKAWMEREGIEYRQFDVDTDAGQAAFEKVGGTRGVAADKRGIPYLLWNGRRIRGFTVENYEEFFRR